MLATELFIALTAVEIKGQDKLSPKTLDKFKEYRLIADFIDRDRNFSIEINDLSNALREVL